VEVAVIVLQAPLAHGRGEHLQGTWLQHQGVACAGTGQMHRGNMRIKGQEVNMT
jgi:hypothetical protein